MLRPSSMGLRPTAWFSISMSTMSLDTSEENRGLSPFARASGFWRMSPVLLGLFRIISPKALRRGMSFSPGRILFGRRFFILSNIPRASKIAGSSSNTFCDQFKPLGTNPAMMLPMIPSKDSEGFSMMSRSSPKFSR